MKRSELSKSSTITHFYTFRKQNIYTITWFLFCQNAVYNISFYTVRNGFKFCYTLMTINTPMGFSAWFFPPILDKL